MEALTYEISASKLFLSKALFYSLLFFEGSSCFLWSLLPEKIFQELYLRFSSSSFCLYRSLSWCSLISFSCCSLISLSCSLMNFDIFSHCLSFSLTLTLFFFEVTLIMLKSNFFNLSFSALTFYATSIDNLSWCISIRSSANSLKPRSYSFLPSSNICSIMLTKPQ